MRRSPCPRAFSRDEFIKRLIEQGKTREEAEAEWDRLQEERPPPPPKPEERG